MREIKFRVWDKQFNKWIRLDYYKDLGAITVETDGTLTLDSAFRFTDSMMIIPNEFEIQQYTGLKDKNGVEIYEGDIVQQFNVKANGVIEYKYGQFGIKCLNMFWNIHPTKLEVIGNIYDNPELLEKEE